MNRVSHSVAAIVVARSKWSPSVMGLYGWLDVHRGLHFFSAISIFIALMIALLTFQPIHSSTGRIHRVLGILVCIIFFCQVKHLQNTIFDVLSFSWAWAYFVLALEIQFERSLTRLIFGLDDLSCFSVG